MPLPDFPVDIDPEHRQIDGDPDQYIDVAETHRRNPVLAPKPAGDRGYMKSVKPRSGLRYREVD
jgi:hypothetical protein